MIYRWDRISYSDEPRCQAGCNRPLTSGIAHIIIDENGQELHCGKDCAEQKAGTKPQGLLNVTLASQNDTEYEGGNSTNGGEGERMGFEGKKKVALEYLLLRAKFNHCRAIHMEQIDDWNGRRHELETDEIYHIYNLRQANLKRNSLSPIFLKRVWELQNQIVRYVRQHPYEKDFLQSFIDFVGSHLSLSPKQKAILLKKIEGVELEFLPDYTKQAR